VFWGGAALGTVNRREGGFGQRFGEIPWAEHAASDAAENKELTEEEVLKTASIWARTVCSALEEEDDILDMSRETSMLRGESACA
jgi:hypothetical protein